MEKTKILPINEIYSCIQGESKYAGRPHFLIRFVGCRLRCQFKGSFCDTSLNSWKPEKGKFTLNDIEELIDSNPQIKYVMVTGGGPTLSAEALQAVCDLCHSKNLFITIETEGSEFVATSADFISLSPKLSNSVPRFGDLNPYTDQVVKESHIEQHNKWRENYSEMKKMIEFHPDYGLKFVVSEESDLEEIKKVQEILGAPNHKVWLMPEGVTDEQLQKKRQFLMEFCVKEGFNYSDRLHVIAFGDKRGV